MTGSFTSVSREHKAGWRHKDLCHLSMLSSPWVNFYSWCCCDISESHMSHLSRSMHLASSARLCSFLWENVLRRCWVGTELLWKSILGRRQGRRLGQGSAVPHWLSVSEGCQDLWVLNGAAHQQPWVQMEDTTPLWRSFSAVRQTKTPQRKKWSDFIVLWLQKMSVFILRIAFFGLQ